MEISKADSSESPRLLSKVQKAGVQAATLATDAEGLDILKFEGEQA